MELKKKTHRCPKGFILRKGYTRKNTGKHVKSTCVRSTSPYSTKAKNTRKIQAMRLGRLLGSRKRCPPGMIARSAYVRKFSPSVSKEGFMKHTKSGKTIKVYPKARSTFVKSACVKDLGKPGKGQAVIGPLRKGELSKYGYGYKLPEADRRFALQQAIKEYGPLSTYRKLNAVAKLSVRSNPKASVSFAADRNWIRQTYATNGELKAF